MFIKENKQKETKIKYLFNFNLFDISESTKQI